MPIIIHEYPKWAERSVRLARIGSYAFCALTGIAAIFITPNSLKPEIYPLVGSMAVFGLICFGATVMKMYVIEWISMFFLTAGTLTYVAAIWITALNNTRAIAGASIFTVLILLMFIRLVDLTVFWMRNVRASRLEQELSDDFR
jgi:hypothetical protein